MQLLVAFTILLAGFYFLLLPPSVAQGGVFRWLGAFRDCSGSWSRISPFYVNFGPLVLSAEVVGRFTWMFVCLGPVFWIEFAQLSFSTSRALAVCGLEILLRCGRQMRDSSDAADGRICRCLDLCSWPRLLSVLWRRRRRKTYVGGAGRFGDLFGYAIACLIAIADIFYGNGIPSAFDLAGFSLWYLDAALLILVPAMAMQIHKINQRFRDEQERLRGEMDAARHVQKFLVPSQSINVPGFEIDASYQPANEVGGDFFQLFSASNNSLLLIVGDVSGKGMKAALEIFR